MSKNKKYKILISGGGTGGHIFPAVAIANGLKDRLHPDVEILFVGAKGRMEMEKVPRAGFDIVGLWISGIQRRMTLKNLLVPLKLISSLWRAGRIVKSFQPDVVVGTGGYASGPLLRAASSKRVPTLILEQNSYPGMTNKWLGKTVQVICTAYEGMEKYFPKEKIVLTGSPVRKMIREMKVEKEEARKFFKLEKDRFTLLIVGGSQGARNMNIAIATQMEQLLASGVQIIWQTGKPSVALARKSTVNSKFRDRVQIFDFIHEMDRAYAAADLIVSRAGAIAIAEIVEVNKPAIFVPLPTAAEDHQTRNAKALADKDAALLIPEKEVEQKLTGAVLRFMKDEKMGKKMRENIQQFSHGGNATDKIVEEVIKLINQ
ncbi:MAG: undecaprenyldiphospho-muramoylpentapeptide beta-N-acetylglucosaminyltransferase [Bacteroidales bacterium]|nr:undecaprenyldiphospho-muramoylpentapeptide beta-N-acetylglucosaminyltransferase [Bacteroidales bacterium]